MACTFVFMNRSPWPKRLQTIHFYRPSGYIFTKSRQLNLPCAFNWISLRVKWRHVTTQMSFKSITLYSLFTILVFGTINNIYVSFFSIHKLDRYFSNKNKPSWESNSPFESFYRLHKYSFLYSFGINRPKVNKAISLWLYFSSFSLACIWVSLGLAAAGKYFKIGPLS